MILLSIGVKTSYDRDFWQSELGFWCDINGTIILTDIKRIGKAVVMLGFKGNDVVCAYNKD